MEKKTKRLIAIILIGMGVILLSISSMMLINNRKSNSKEQSSNQINEKTYNYVAYIKINPSIKLEYYEICKDDVCDKPIVKKYELVNDDAKNIFKDIDLLKDKQELDDVLNLICNTVKNNNISFDKVEIFSDWKNLNNYLEENKIDNQTWSYINNITETDKISEVIETKEKEEIKEKQEAKEKEETLKKTAEETKKNENQSNQQATKSNKEVSQPQEETKTRNNYTIYLSDGVSYSHTGEAYCCEECFTNELINKIKNAKGYYVVQATSSQIDFRKIVNLSGNYNTTLFLGESLVSKLTEAGGENCAGLGGGPEPLTKEICNQYHLICE